MAKNVRSHQEIPFSISIGHLNLNRARIHEEIGSEHVFQTVVTTHQAKSIDSAYHCCCSYSHTRPTTVREEEHIIPHLGKVGRAQGAEHEEARLRQAVTVFVDGGRVGLLLGLLSGAEKG